MMIDPQQKDTDGMFAVKYVYRGYLAKVFWFSRPVNMVDQNKSSLYKFVYVIQQVAVVFCASIVKRKG